MKKLIAVLISLMLLCGAALPALAEDAAINQKDETGIQKDETVYILAAADGTANRVIVSDYLSNPSSAAELADVSSLSNIENVKGAQTFENGVWQAEGEDIYYQGEGETPLPVELNISYSLNGEPIAPDELAGRNGHVAIRFDFIVNQTGETGLSVPYAFVTGALLENDVFKNVQATNARVVNDGDRTVVLGIALPGLKDSLDLNFESVDIADIPDLPEYIQIEADATNFSLPVTLTLATGEVFASLDADKLVTSQSLKDAVSKLSDGMAQLLDGGARLEDGLAALDTGVDELAGGVNALADGLATLVSNNDDLVSGSTQVFNTLLAAANSQLAAANAGAPELTIENYDETLAALLDAMSEDGVARQARAQVEQAVRSQQDQVRAAVEQAVQAEAPAQLSSDELQAIIDEKTEAQLQALVDQNMASAEVQAQIEQSLAQYAESRATLAALRDQLNAYNAFHSGIVAYTRGASSAADGANQLRAGLPALEDGVAQLLDGARAMLDGLEMFSDEAVDKLDRLVSEDLEQLLERVRELIRTAQASRNYSGIADGVDASARYIWRTDAIGD